MHPATKELIDLYWGIQFLNARTINDGNCLLWAVLARRHCRRAKLLKVTHFGLHAFVKIGDRFFDSETPSGVRDWRDLPYFKRVSGSNLVTYYPSDARPFTKMDVHRCCRTITTMKRIRRLYG